VFGLSAVGSTQGIGYGILRALAGAGATTVMHGLVPEAELRHKAAEVAREFGVETGVSAANVMKPAEIRCVRSI
jgi:3-hydroxybutyrate dehydrogenase